jgi:hypothetical protein
MALRAASAYAFTMAGISDTSRARGVGYLQQQHQHQVFARQQQVRNMQQQKQCRCTDGRLVYDICCSNTNGATDRLWRERIYTDPGLQVKAKSYLNAVLDYVWSTRCQRSLISANTTQQLCMSDNTRCNGCMPACWVHVCIPSVRAHLNWLQLLSQLQCCALLT